jgi:quercetin dioxygenase-like cupin family protein
MGRGSTATALLAAVFFTGSAAAQTTPAAPAVQRTLVAAARLDGVADAPIYFRAVRVILPASGKSSVSAGDGIVYQFSGSTAVSFGGEVKMLNVGEGLFIESGRTLAFQAGASEPSIFLHFLLAHAADLDRPVAAAPAVVTELYRTAAPIPDLKPGTYDFNLSRVTFPAHWASNAPHHRSGAALYYVVSGSGANTIEGKTDTRGPGSLIYEPSRLIHQWGNPGDEPFTFLAFNINPEGTPAVVPATPPRPQ